MVLVGASIYAFSKPDLCCLESLMTWYVCADHVAWGLAVQVYERAVGREPRVFQGPGEARS